MSKDHRRLEVFTMADALVVPIYLMTRSLPSEEKYGLCSQLRRACVSVPTNLVEGCSRKGSRELAHFARIALGSASEISYLLTIVQRLEFSVEMNGLASLIARYESLVRALQAFLTYLESDQ